MSFREVYAATGPGDADLVRLELENAGIAATIRNMPLAGSGGELGYAAAVCAIDVHEKDFAAAEAIVEAHMKHRADAKLPDVPCPKCAEPNPVTFDICWSCGAAMRLAAAE